MRKSVYTNMSVKAVLFVFLSAILATNYFYNVILPPNEHIRFPEIAKADGYRGEEHEAVTEDGYVLSIFRIRGKCEQLGTPVVILHGLTQSSDSWLDAGDGSLPYLLSDECHDVWLGNMRGNYYGRRHKSLDPDKDDQFWQFSADEIGYYDIPAIIDLILNVTKAPKLNYIGFSQGGGCFYMMCSERPEYNAKVNAMIGLGTPTTLKRSQTGIFRYVFKTVSENEGIFYKLGINEVLSRHMLAHRLIKFVCTITDRGCSLILSSFDDMNLASLSDYTLRVIYNHIPDGTSIRTLARYGQAGTSGKFQKYDFGAVGNVKKYGSESPPLYQPQKITVPILLVQGHSDSIVNITDVEEFSRKLPNLKEWFVIKDFNHFDMVYSKDLKKLMFPKIKEYLLQCKNSC